jgi:hypothetical protein
VAGAGECDYVSAPGGVLWLRCARQPCCFGAMTSMRPATSRPANAADYLPMRTDLPIETRLLNSPALPNEVSIELRGLPHKHLVALWDGCKFRI